jgi:hypothetical protein
MGRNPPIADKKEPAMRNPYNRLMIGTAIAGLALLVSACGSSEKATPTDTNVLDANIATDVLDNGTVSDITATDATLGAEANAANVDDAAANSADETATGNGN